jgi:formylmethanofuran dehydrogenase subunit E
MKTCDLCGDKFKDNELTKTEDGMLCKDCASIVDECDGCGCAIREDDEKYYVDETDKLYCEECAEKMHLMD